MNTWKVIHGDCLESLKGLTDDSIDCCVTSPPYWALRNYQVEGQLGLESTPEEYVSKLVTIFKEVKRVLKPTGNMWLNLGDTYATAKVGNTQGSSNSGLNGNNPREDLSGLREQSKFVKKTPVNLKTKDLVGIPWMVAFALRDDGWYLRQDIIWQKPSCLPEPVTDRCVKSHEYIFLLSKSSKYYFDYLSIQENSTNKESHEGHRKRNKTASYGSGAFINGKGNAISSGDDSYTGKTYVKRNKRSVWTVPPYNQPGKNHFASYPPDLITPCILAGCPKGGTVLDPFCGSGTTGEVAIQLSRNFIGMELNPDYVALSRRVISRADSLFSKEIV
jgi:DNA modification methylase